MKTLIIILAFSACAFGTSTGETPTVSTPTYRCSPPKCPADCGIDTGDNGCPKCACLKNDTIVTIKPTKKCSPPLCSKGCTLENVPGDCPRCSCQGTTGKGGKNSTCPQVKCPGECAIGLDANGCQLCQCAKGKKNSTCPHVKCPGECAIGLDANGCQLCQCAQGTKSGNGLDKQLGETCLSATDCIAAYSSCQNNKCACLDGFKADNGVCKPPALQCPSWGQPNSAVGKACEHHFNQTTNAEEHTCNKNSEFCFVHPKEKTETGRSVGHCCPLPPQDASISVVCPYAASNNGTCPDLSSFPADAPIPEGKQRTCSYVTSECVHHFHQGVCCPIPCTGASSHFSVNGKCYDYVQIGEVCDNDAVCIGGSRCTHQGSGKPLCRCAKKTCYEPSQHCCE